MSAPIVVRVVTHRELDTQGRRLGHVAYVQRRSSEKMARFGGRRFASRARRTLDGIETGCPERFETYEREAEARAHADYAARRAP